MLQMRNIQPFFVFDGNKRSPIKASTDAERRKKKLKNFAAVQGLIDGADGDFSTVEIDESVLKAAASVKTTMVLAVVAALRAEGLPYVVAPHEGDPQIAYIAKRYREYVVLTIDSDLIIQDRKSVV